jgi:hypothetical protein
MGWRMAFRVRHEPSPEDATMTWPGDIGHGVIGPDNARIAPLFAIGRCVPIQGSTSVGRGR